MVQMKVTYFKLPEKEESNTGSLIQVAKANYDDLQKKAKQVPAKHWAILIGLLVFDLI